MPLTLSTLPTTQFHHERTSCNSEVLFSGPNAMARTGAPPLRPMQESPTALVSKASGPSNPAASRPGELGSWRLSRQDSGGRGLPGVSAPATHCPRLLQPQRLTLLAVPSLWTQHAQATCLWGLTPGSQCHQESVSLQRSHTSLSLPQLLSVPSKGREDLDTRLRLSMSKRN